MDPGFVLGGTKFSEGSGDCLRSLAVLGRVPLGDVGGGASEADRFSVLLRLFFPHL